MTQLTQEELVSILQSALSAFREEIDGDITASRILTLLAAVKSPGLQQVDVAQFVKGLSASAISRNVLDWSDVNSARKAGPDFIVQRPDPAFRKRNVLYPTPKGLSFLTRLTSRVNGTLAPRGGAGSSGREALAG